MSLCQAITDKMIHPFIKFGALSGAGWVLDSVLLIVLSQKAGISLSIANFISSSIAALLVFTVARYFVFYVRSANSLLKTLLYFCYTCAIIVIASSFIEPIVLLVQYLFSKFTIEATSGQIAFSAKVIITPPQLIANFLVSRYIAHKKLGTGPQQ